MTPWVCYSGSAGLWSSTKGAGGGVVPVPALEVESGAVSIPPSLIPIPRPCPVRSSSVPVPSSCNK